jgi:Clp amino terminal domain, pathogenicity island component
MAEENRSMFERYTEKARRVIFFARYAASEFGSPYIESEFLLLGLLREDQHIVIRWLGDGDWQTILRNEVEKYVYPGPKTLTSVDLPLSDEAKRVLAYASEEAVRLAHEHIGSEHLFLGLLRDKNSRAAKMLLDRGVNPDTVRETLAGEGDQQSVSGFGLGSGRAGLRTFEVVLRVEGVTEPLPVQWPARIPAIGETLLLESVAYRVANVEWMVEKRAGRPISVPKVVIHSQRSIATKG